MCELYLGVILLNLKESRNTSFNNTEEEEGQEEQKYSLTYSSCILMCGGVAVYIEVVSSCTMHKFLWCNHRPLLKKEKWNDGSLLLNLVVGEHCQEEEESGEFCLPPIIVVYVSS